MKEVELTPQQDEQPEIDQDLLRARDLLAQGRYNSSLRESRRVLSRSAGQPPGDEALFNIGLIFARQGNPKKDYPSSVASFKRLIKEYPESPLAEQARTLIEVLEENIRLKRVSSDALQENVRLKRIIEQSKKVDVEIEEKKREEAK